MQTPRARPSIFVAIRHTVARHRLIHRPRMAADVLRVRVRECMTERVFSATPERDLAVAEEIMSWANVRHVPVVDDKRRVLGILTERDLLRWTIRAGADGADETAGRVPLSGTAIRDVMTVEVATIDPDASIQAAARLMHRNKYGCLPVVDDRGRLVGILSAIDLMRVIVEVDAGSALSPL